MECKTILMDLVGTLYDSENHRLFDDAVPVLEQLNKHCFMVLITELKPGKARLIRRLGLCCYFDLIIIAKKDSLLFSDQLQDGKCIVIGDAAAEIAIAKKLNLPWLLIDRNPDSHIGSTAKDSRLICSLHQILKKI